MLNMQNVKDIEITEGKVRTIHDKDSRLIWGRLAYDTKYAGDTYQQTYSGKNLLPSNPAGTSTPHNLTITVDNTGRITVNGTADANVYFNLNKVTLAAGSYMLSGLPFNGSSSSFRIGFKFGGTIQSLFSVNGKTFTIDNTYTATEAFLFIAKNYTANNLVFEPMIESGSTKTSYEPYVGGIPAPNPDYPQAVQTVTGEQTVTVSDGVDSEAFSISLGSLELCKISDYQDYIYKSGDDWYVHKAVGEIPNYNGETIITDYISTTGSLTNGATVYYGLDTATDTKITDATLISELDAVHEWLTRYGYSATVTGNLPIIINQTNL